MSSKLPPGKIDRNPPPSNRQLLILLGIFLALVAGVIWLLGWLLNGLIWLIPPNVERQLGNLVVPAYERQAKPSEAQEALNQLLDRLEARLPKEQRQERDYRVLYIPDRAVNALALPGDRIVVYRGLIAQAQSENELMMVLGHELGHFAHRDHLRGIVRPLLLQIAIAAIFGDVGGLSGTAAAAIEAVGRSQFSQGQEREADEFGLTLLQAEYGQAAGAADFFARLSQERGANIAFLSTHPAPGDRAKEIQRLIAQRRYSIGEKTPLPAALKNLPDR